MKYQAVLFDLDGTLLDSLEDLADSMNQVLQKCGYPVYEVEKYKEFLGDGMYPLVCRTLPGEIDDEKIRQKCLAAMKEEYNRRWAVKTRPYPGIMELLAALRDKGLRLAVLSNKPDEFVQEIIKKYFHRINFAVVQGEQPGIPKKPDPQGALEIARMMGLSPEKFLYLGDTNTDMQTANNAGMFAVGVLWGFRGAEELLANGARELIAKPLDLLRLL